MKKTFDKIMEEPTFRDIVENLSENDNGHDASSTKTKMVTHKISSLTTCYIKSSLVTHQELEIMTIVIF